MDLRKGFMTLHVGYRTVAFLISRIIWVVVVD
jgi:hypothetical protein